MSTYGSITSYIDVAQLTLYGFFLFFACLVFYLRSEDKREGFPMESERVKGARVPGFPPIPSPKIFRLKHGEAIKAPRDEVFEDVKARPAEPWPGAPLVPTGNPLADGVGPAAWCKRAEQPELTFDDGLPKIVPLRAAPGYFTSSEDPTLAGMTVIDCDEKPVGTVVDAWFDIAEMVIRYLEVDITASGGVGRRLIPMPLADVRGRRRQVRVRSLRAAQFAGIPVLAQADQITMREEDQVMGYVGGGTLYATATRVEPLL